MRAQSRTVIALLAVLAASAAPGQERARSNQMILGYGKPAKPPVERVDPCKAQGPGFHTVPGTSSCVRVTGRVRMDSGMTMRLR